MMVGVGKMVLTKELPLYLRISERLIRDMAAGHLKAGSKLAPEREMAAQLGVAVGTLRKALTDLEKKGLIHRVHGSGNYVRKGPARGQVYGYLHLERREGGGLPTARMVSITRHDEMPDGLWTGPAWLLRRIRDLDGVPAALEEIWVDATRISFDIADKIPEMLYLHYQENNQVEIARIEDRVSAAPVPDWAGEAGFSLAPGALAGYAERQAWAGRVLAPLEFSRSWFDPAQACYVVREGLEAQ